MSKKHPNILTVANDNRKSRRLGRFIRQASVTFLSALLVFQPALVSAQQVTPDVSAPVINQPGVGAAPNGVPLVDIVTPNDQGLSHNKYDQFNVGTPGLILNNHNGEVGTSALGGVTPGNANLKNSGPASVILNEVTKQNRSSLDGPVEVFGGRADVIIANPNGITCNGCGFINTPRATLTTGTPDIDVTGRLSGFTVNGGDVTFGEKGGNFANGRGSVDLFDVVSRSIHVNGAVYGKDLRLTAGRNKFDYATGEAKALEAIGGTPEYAIDGSALGAMQAGRIKIVVTEKGAGVRMRADMAANAGELSLSSDGKISVGNVSGNQGVTLRSKDKVTAKTVTSKKRVIVQADKGITLDAVAADEDVLATSGTGLLSIAGDVSSLANVELTSAAGISVGGVTATNGGAILASTSGDIAIAGKAAGRTGLTIIANAGSITAGSLVSFNNMTLTSGLDIGVAGDMLAAGKLVAAGGSIRGGNILSGVDIAATSASPSGNVIFSNAGDMTLVARSGSLTAASLGAAGQLNATATAIHAGNVTGHQDIALTGNTAVSGQILGGENILIIGQAINAGTIVSGVDFAASNASPSGAIIVGPTGDLVINATSSGTVNTGTLLSAGLLDVTAASLTAQNVTGHQSIRIAANTNVGGQILGGSDISVTGSDIRAGAIVSGVDFAATANSASGDVVLGNTGGTSTAGGATTAGNLNLNATSGSINVGTLLSVGNLTGTAAQNINANAVSRQALSLTAGNAINLSGQSLSGSDFVLKAGSINVDTLVSGVDFAASATSPTGNLVLSSSGAMLLNAAQGSVTANNLTSGGNLSAHASQNITYNSVQSFGSAAFAADQGSISLDKTTRAQGDISLTAQSFDFSNNRGKNLATASNLILNASSANFAGSTYTWGGLGLQLTGNADFTGTTLNAITNSGGSGNITVNAAGITINSSSALLAQNDLTLTLASLTNPGQLAAGHDLILNIAGDLTNTPTGLIYSGNDAKLYVAGNLLNDQGAIMAGHDLAIAANVSNAKNQSVTNISGLIRAENDVSIFSENLTNKRLTTPTWENVLISDNGVMKFQINPETWGKPVALLFNEPNGQTWQTFMTDPEAQKLFAGIDRLNTNEWFAKLYGVVTLADGTSFRTKGITPGESMPWIWGESLHSNAQMIAWLKKTQPLNPDGSLRLDPNVPVTSIANHNTGGQFAWTFSWDNDTQISQSVYEDRLTGDLSPEAMIHAGRNLSVDATTLNNSYSAIEAGGNATLKGSVLNNEGVALHRTTLTKCEANGGCQAYNADGTRNAINDLGDGVSRLTSDVALGGVPGTIKAAGNLDISGFGTVNNTSAPGSMAGSAALTPSNAPGNPTDALAGLTAGAALFTPNAALGNIAAGSNPTAGADLKAALANSIAKPNSGGFGGTIPGQIFLYETRAQFLDVSKFYGSGYFINRLGYKPDWEIPFLGDAYFENQLIDTQLRQLVGQGLGKGSFIPGSDAIEQMKLLLDNGIAYAKAHNLKIGEQLSPEQAATLTQSVVLYEKKNVQGVEVLAPVVYLANADKANLTVAGALISGGSLNMNVGDVNNSGAIASRTDLKLVGTNIKANGGSFIAGGNLQLQSAGDLTLNAQSLTIGGTNVLNPNGATTAGGNAILSANNNLTIQGVGVNAGGNASLAAKNVTLDVAKVDNNGTQDAAGAKITSGGNLGIAAKDNVTVIGSSANAGGALGVTAENGSVNVVTADVAKDVHGRAEKRTSETVATVQKQSELSSGTDTTIMAGDDILLSGSKIQAGGNANLAAGDDINITTAQNQTAVKAAEHSSTTITNTGSEIKAGGNIAVVAGGASAASTDSDHDLNIIGSKLDAGGKVQLKASDDITIAEATDSAVVDTKTSSKGIFSSKKATTHTETTTAVGSSISGGTGIDIASGNDTTIAASKIQAGTKNNKADLNITAGGDLTIASGKDTQERHDASSGKGFLSKQSAKLDSYDERTVASELGASGNVNLNAGDSATIAGSSVNAGESITIGGDSVSVIGTPENHAFESRKKKSGLGAGSGDGFVSIWGKEQKDVQQSLTLNSPSLLSAGKDVTVTARETDINVLGSQIAAGQDIDLYANRDVNVLPGAESSSSYEKEKKSGFGLSFSSGGGGASIGIGFGSSTDKSVEGSETNAVSSLTAGRDLTITAGRDANLQAAQVAAERDVAIVAARDVNLLSAQDKSNYEEVHEKLFAGVTLSVSTSLVSTADSVSGAAQKLGNISDGYSAANAAFASMKAYDALHSIAKGGNLASASLTAGFSYSKDKAEGSASIPVVTTVRGGQSVTIEATSGNLTGHGAQIIAGYDANGKPIVSDNEKAGDISLKAGKDIILESAQATNEASTSSKSAGASIGVSAGVGINGPNIGMTGGFNFGKGSSSANGTAQVNSHVTGTGDIKLESGNDTTLKGAVVSGETVTAKVGGDLNIISVPDTGTSKNSSAGFGMNFAGPLDLGSPLSGGMPSLPSQAGNMGLTGINPSGGYGSGDTNWISEQSGLISKGKMDVDVAGNTHLGAGKIISETGDLTLQTGTLTHEDFKGQKQYEGVNVDLGIDLTGGKGSEVNPVGNSTAEGSYQLDDTRQSVRATVGPGEITIRDEQKQAALEQDAATAPLSELNRDPNLAYEITKDKHVDLEVYVSTDSVKAAIDAGKTVVDIVGDALNRMAADGKLNKEDLSQAQKLQRHLNDPNVQEQIAKCSDVCIIETTEETIAISEYGATIAVNVSVAAKIEAAGLAVGAAATFLATTALLASTSSAGNQINNTTTLSNGTTITVTGKGPETARYIEIAPPGGDKVSLNLTTDLNGNLILTSGTIDGYEMPQSVLQKTVYTLQSGGMKNVVLSEGAGGKGGDHQYHPKPKTEEITGIPGLRPAKPLGGRPRWIDSKGEIYEWDFQHGALEKYNKKGNKHLGEYDPKTGKQTKPPKPERKTPT